MTDLAIRTALPVALQPVAEQARQFIRERHSDSTRRAYASDLLSFKAWADTHGIEALPASPAVVVLYLTAEAKAGKKPATLVRRLAAIRYMHKEAGMQTPTDDESVRAALSGIRRSVGSAQRQVAPATADKVGAMLNACGDSMQGLRDRALLALGFGGAFRRSELAALTVADIEFTDVGVRVRIARSKTDQEGEGQTVPVLDGNRLRVKAALRAWMDAAGIKDGPVFRPLTKSGKARAQALTDRSVADIVKKRAEQCGLDPEQFSGHSLRAGFLTSAAASGASLFKMMEVSRHKKVDTVRGYIRMAEQFKDHAGSAFM